MDYADAANTIISMARLSEKIDAMLWDSAPRASYSFERTRVEEDMPPVT